MNLALRRCVCIFHLVRVFSSILFAIMTLVLPMAAVQRYVCTLDMNFSGDVEDCPMNCCDCGDDHQNVPECMVKADPLPDADFPNFAQIPYSKSDEVIYLRLSVADLRGNTASPARSEHRRGPPDSREWYVKQQRLLI